MNDRYESPLCGRYASSAIQKIFSNDTKFTTWRKLWLALAESQQELGIEISDEQLTELRANLTTIDYALVATLERELRHDVMAHIHAYGQQCPTAKGIIHLGATSCYVGDNTDIIQMKAGLTHVRQMLINVISALAQFAERNKTVPTLGYTHFQPAQPVTVGKRAALWLQDLLFDLDQLEFMLPRLKLLGCKGTTGTGASFLTLFAGDQAKVQLLEQKIAIKMGFDDVYPVSGQTYSRKVDFQVLTVLSSIAQSATKFSNDIRLLAHLRELEEPFAASQVGSSAMAYKRNPMQSERIASLARHVITTALNPALTAAGQWLERTLDDSANRRITIPEAFLGVDAILALMLNVVQGLTVYPQMITKHLAAELPFMATETILMYCVQRGGDRQQLHEAIRRHSIAAAQQVKCGHDNDLLTRLVADPLFNLTQPELAELLDTTNFTGLAAEQTEHFLTTVVQPVLDKYKSLLNLQVTIEV